MSRYFPWLAGGALAGYAARRGGLTPRTRRRKIEGLYRAFAGGLEEEGNCPLEGGYCGDAVDFVWHQSGPWSPDLVPLSNEDVGSPLTHNWLYDPVTKLHYDMQRPAGVADWKELPALRGAGGAALGYAARRGRRGVYDPGVLKAVFLAGGPGSGKSYVAESVFGLTSASFAPSGLKLVNSDPFFELLLKREGIDPADLADLPSMTYKYATEAPTGPRMRAKALSEARASAWIDQRLGLVVEGTGRRFEKIERTRNMLRGLGYDTAMVYVNTSLPVALARNARRSRRLPEHVVTQLWNESQENMGRFQTLFGRRRFYLVDNSRPVPVDTIIVRAVERFIQAPVRNPIGKRWIAQELRKRRR